MKFNLSRLLAELSRADVLTYWMPYEVRAVAHANSDHRRA